MQSNTAIENSAPDSKVENDFISILSGKYPQLKKTVREKLDYFKKAKEIRKGFDDRAINY